MISVRVCQCSINCSRTTTEPVINPVINPHIHPHIHPVIQASDPSTAQGQPLSGAHHLISSHNHTVPSYLPPQDPAAQHQTLTMFNQLTTPLKGLHHLSQPPQQPTDTQQPNTQNPTTATLTPAQLASTIRRLFPGPLQLSYWRLVPITAYQQLSQLLMSPPVLAAPSLTPRQILGRWVAYVLCWHVGRASVASSGKCLLSQDRFINVLAVPACA